MLILAQTNSEKCERHLEVYYDECTNKCLCRKGNDGNLYASCTEMGCFGANKLDPSASSFTFEEFQSPNFSCVKATEWFHVDCNFCKCKPNMVDIICSKRNCNTFVHSDDLSF